MADRGAELDVDEIERCEGCETLLHPDAVRLDVEGTVLCEECHEAAPKVRWNGEEWVGV